MVGWTWPAGESLLIPVLEINDANLKVERTGFFCKLNW